LRDPLLFVRREMDGGACLSETKYFENPLVNNKKLRQLYTVMVEARMLDEHVAGLKRGRKAPPKPDSTRGQEACRVSTAIELTQGDLVSDTQDGLVMELVTGVRVGALLKRFADAAKGTKGAKTAGRGRSGRLLPWVEDVDDRLRLALGAALAFRTLKQTNIVVAYVRSGEASEKTWLKTLGIASKFELPIIFVVLPGEPGKGRGAAKSVSATARLGGVPGIAVDASDSVALYRVAQESIGRTRGDGGPVVIEGVSYRLEGKRGDGVGDPIDRMKEFVLGRRICTEAWVDRVGESFSKRIKGAR
jgi:acetoin:2,6-dichlorophenolindophenol oxidoreductase subunit alpha